MLIKVASSYSGKIATGSYENASPFFSAEIEVGLTDQVVKDGSSPEQVIDTMQKKLQEICYQNFKAAEHKAIIEKIQKERSDFRWYEAKDIGTIPSVTSIIGFDSDFGIPPGELQQYASQSQICHAQVTHYILTGEWVDPEKLGEIWADLFILKKGNLMLEAGGWDFPGFLQKYPITEMRNGVALINKEKKYGGTPDFYGMPNFNGAKRVKSICDVKRTVDKVKAFMQMAAYAKCPGNEDIEQMIIVPLNNKTEQGFSKPVVSCEIDKYNEMFLRKRADFEKVYGV